ncbi:MAG: HlyD family secretion protein [Stigonema ocellatum SAG 48.90 = DSM 106950]|nr:HlyD family secretion protein [Stigonema ocellatum SAG 48.90 = DSM 106950]
MERLNSSQQIQQVAELDKQKTPVLEQDVAAITSTTSNSDIQKPVSPSPGHLLPKLVLGVLLSTGAIASGIYAYRWWHYTQQYGQKYQKTDNAYVTADIYRITSPISGIVTELSVNDNQVVYPSDILVKLDQRNYLVSLAQAKASLELAKQQAALAQKKLEAAIYATVPKPVFLNKDTPQAKQAAVQQRMLQTQTIKQQKEINQQQYKTALATIKAKQMEVQKDELELSYTNITAMTYGKVGNKNVQVGQMVQPGQTLITVVQPHPWIIANFKETQLEKIQPGQKVEIRIAAFPNRQFQGKVDSVSPTSFGKVALFPQDNAPMTSIKSSDIQQIPVKIVLDPESTRGYESRITPGMSAVATVETR